MRRIPWIDPLRAIAALLVLVSHVAYWSGGSSVDGVGRLLARGDVGVAIFFAVSAFLLTREACAGRHAAPGYWRRRAARILPGYLVTFCGVVIVAVMLGTGEATWRSVLAHLFLVQGWTGDSFRGFTQAWSLTTEVTFYLCVPLLCAWLRRCREARRSPVPVLAAVAGSGVLLQTLTASSGRASLGVVSTSLLGHAAWFAVGMACAWMTAQPGLREPATPGPEVSRLGAAAAARWSLVLFVLAATPLAGPIHLETPSPFCAFAKELLYATIAGLSVWAAATVTRDPEPGAAAGLRRSGDLSYPVFLWHVLVLQVLFAALHLPLFHTSFPLVLVVTVVASLALAEISWRLVELPVLRRVRPAPRVGADRGGEDRPGEGRERRGPERTR